PRFEARLKNQPGAKKTVDSSGIAGSERKSRRLQSGAYGLGRNDLHTSKPALRGMSGTGGLPGQKAELNGSNPFQTQRKNAPALPDRGRGDLEGRPAFDQPAAL